MRNAGCLGNVIYVGYFFLKPFKMKNSLFSDSGIILTGGRIGC